GSLPWICHSQRTGVACAALHQSRSPAQPAATSMGNLPSRLLASRMGAAGDTADNRYRIVRRDPSDLHPVAHWTLARCRPRYLRCGRHPAGDLPLVLARDQAEANARPPARAQLDAVSSWVAPAFRPAFRVAL